MRRDAKPAHGLEFRLPPLLVAVLAAAAMAGLAQALPGLTFALPGRLPAAVALCAAGAAVGIASIVEFRRIGTTVNPLTPDAASRLVSAGIYRYSRNPMYLGMLLALTGWAAWLANLGALVLLPAFVAWIDRFQIVPEERALLARFGQPYADYLASARRWI